MLHLTPATLEATYELLRTLPPYNKWRLPHADNVEFHVTKLRKAFGDHTQQGNGTHRIRVCVATNGSVCELVETMAHEMVHLRQRITDAGRVTEPHGRKFMQLADEVCRALSFDFKKFIGNVKK